MKSKLVDPAILNDIYGLKVLCHGVFDILHVGHIRYFNEAKKHGDILIVSLTKDEYVKKGPGRPYFNLADRIEQISALEVVDYIVISDDVSACTLINQISPSKYCKGIEYKNNDIAGNLEQEVRALNQVGGEIIFIDTLKDSSTEIYFQIFKSSDSGSKSLADLRKKYSIEYIEKIFLDITCMSINVIGELIIDTYASCWVENVSSKSPSLSGRYLSEERYLGGIGAVIQMLLELGVNVTGFSHWVESQEVILGIKKELLRAKMVNLQSQDFAAPEKIRYIHKDNEQRIFELTKISNINEVVEYKTSHLTELQKKSDLTLIYDFGHGFVSDDLRSLFLDKDDVWVNAQTNSDNYGYNLITKYKGFKNIVLDRREASLAVGNRNLSNENLYQALMMEMHPENLCLTLGRDGCLYENKKSFPALANNAKDATGAGDAFYLMYALIYKVTKEKYLAAALGSMFAAEKVKIIGHNPALTVSSFKKSLFSIFK